MQMRFLDSEIVFCFNIGVHHRPSSRNRECLHQSHCGSKGMRLKGGAQVKEEEVSVGEAVVSGEMGKGSGLEDRKMGKGREKRIIIR